MSFKVTQATIQLATYYRTFNLHNHARVGCLKFLNFHLSVQAHKLEGVHPGISYLFAPCPCQSPFVNSPPPARLGPASNRAIVALWTSLCA